MIPTWSPKKEFEQQQQKHKETVKDRCAEVWPNKIKLKAWPYQLIL